MMKCCSNRVIQNIKAALLMLLLTCLPFMAQAKPTVDEMNAKWIYNIVDYVEWNGRNSDLVICTIGRSKIDRFLEKLIEDGSSRIKQVKRTNIRSNFSSCHLLFISSSERRAYSDILESVGDAPLLTMSAIENFAHNGGMVELSYGRNSAIILNISNTPSQSITFDGDFLGFVNVIQ